VGGERLRRAMPPNAKASASVALETSSSAPNPFDVLPLDALVHVCARASLVDLGRLAATCREAERVVDEATSGALRMLRAARFPARCATLTQTCSALRCTPSTLRRLPGYRASRTARITLIGVLEGLRSSKGGWAAVCDELRATRGRREKEAALANQRAAKRRERLSRLDAWFAGVAKANRAACAAGSPPTDVQVALQERSGASSVEKKWGALCTLSEQTGEAVFPSAPLGHGEGVCSFNEWVRWLYGTRFARMARVPLPKSVETFARSEVLNAASFGRVTRELLAFDARVRHAVACEDDVHAHFASKRLLLPDTRQVCSWRKHFWDPSHTGCATGYDAAQAIKRETVARVYDAEKEQMLLARQFALAGCPEADAADAATVTTVTPPESEAPFVSIWPPSARAESPSPPLHGFDFDEDEALLAMMGA
jgi:hypothetical protein